MGKMKKQSKPWHLYAVTASKKALPKIKVVMVNFLLEFYHVKFQVPIY